MDLAVNENHQKNSLDFEGTEQSFDVALIRMMYTIQPLCHEDLIN